MDDELTGVSLPPLTGVEDGSDATERVHALIERVRREHPDVARRIDARERSIERLHG